MFSRSPVRRAPRRLRSLRTIRGFRPGVESLERRDLLATFIVTTTADGPGANGLTLREAIQLANETDGADVIAFNIAGPANSVFTIQPEFELPTIYDSVRIDGTTQLTFNGGTIELSGNQMIEGSNGLTINSSHTTVVGLVINRFQFGAGILLQFAERAESANTIQGNRIGTDVAGSSAPGFGNRVGIAIQDSGNLIGGTLDSDRNIISGNSEAGITIDRFASSNQVLGNYIGTSLSGLEALANGIGIFLTDGANNTLVDGNLISGNTGDGVRIAQTSDNPQPYQNTISNNLIGTDVTSLAPLGNGGAGISIQSSSGNTILGNTIFANGGLGIQLLRGGNDNQPAPTIDAITIVDGTIQIAWSLASPSTSGEPFRIEFFSSTAADPSGFGEGQQFIGFVSANTDEFGAASGIAVFTLDGLIGPFFSATATTLERGNTSEFSNIVLAPFADLALSLTVDDPTPSEGQVVRITVTLTNNGPSDATGITLNGTLPQGLAYLSSELFQGTYDPTTGTWTVGGLASGSSLALVILALVGPGTANNLLTSHSLIAHSDQLDLNPANDQASAGIIPALDAVPDLPTVHEPPVLPTPVPSLAAPFTATPVLPTAGSTTVSSQGIPGASFVQAIDAGKSGGVVDVPEMIMLEAAPDLTLAFVLLLVPEEAPDNATMTARASSQGDTVGSITGIVFEDTNGDGIWQPDEPTLEGMAVYLDLPGGLEGDENKPFALTDANGKFRFDGLTPGPYTVRTVPHRLYVVSSPETGAEHAQVEPGNTAAVTFGCKPQSRRQPSNPDARMPSQEMKMDETAQAPVDSARDPRDEIFLAGDAWQPTDAAAWLGALAIASVMTIQSRRRRTISDAA